MSIDFNHQIHASNIVYILDEFDTMICSLHEKEQAKKTFFDEHDDNKKCDDNDEKNKQIEEICVRDYLNVFQGPVPIDGRIIIATTNNYEKIKKICPELFRPGRLTPVYFGYPTRKIIEEITQYYFDKEIDIQIPDVLEISTSQIIEICMDAQHNDDPYKYYISKMEKNINKR